jgi:small-conductance mechanosensitive channel
MRLSLPALLFMRGKAKSEERSREGMDKIEFLQLAVAGVVALGVPVAGRIIGKRLERFRTLPERPIRSWLSEIGSDIQWLLYVLGLLSGLAIAVFQRYAFVLPFLLIAGKIATNIFLLLITIAAISVASLYASYIINTGNFTQNDRRNLTTLLPIAVSFAKLITYFAFVLLCLLVFKVNITPFLEAGAIISIILGIAGQNILSDILSTLFVFTDRLFYVGDTVSVPVGSGDVWMEGVVISISLRYTIIRLEASGGDCETLAVANRTLDRFLRRSPTQSCDVSET